MQNEIENIQQLTLDNNLQISQIPPKYTNGLDEISDFIFTSKYANYNKKLKRRETLPEAVDFIRDMHLDKYNFLSKDDQRKVKSVFELVKQKYNVPSMRSMQFRSPAITQHNGKIYNCGVRHIDSLRAFAEFFYCLLCGTGMTAGLTKQVISLLPDLANDKDKTGSVITYTIEDNIEGWADSLEVLLMSYHKNTPFTGRKIIFDFSKIRKKGTPLKTSGGKAPGHEGLKASLQKIKEILDHAIEDLKLKQLRSIDIYDILMHSADAVLSGGIRRAATAVIFDPDDQDLMTAKVNFQVSSYKRFEQLPSGYWEGTVYVNKKKYEVTISDWEYQTALKLNNEISWIHIEPQRARSNNSVLLLRDKTSLEQFLEIVENTRKWGEPGFVFADDPLTLFNPCFEISFLPKTKDGRFGVQFCVTGDTNLITKEGLTTIKDSLGKNINIWNGENWSNVTPKKTQTNVDIYRVQFSDGSFLDCTDNHKFIVKKNYQKEFYEMSTIEILNSIKKSSKNKFFIPRSNIKIDETFGINEEYAYEYGYFKGDGHIANKNRNPYPNVCIYDEKDTKLGLRYRVVADNMFNVYGTSYFEATFDNLDIDLCLNLKKELPNIIFSWNKKSILSFIAGWADADGSNASKGIRIYGDYLSLKKGQLLLTKIGIDSSLNLMEEKGSITNLGERKKSVWYLQITKTIDIPCRRLNCTNKESSKFKGRNQQINSIILLPNKQDVYCLEDKELHQCVFNNVLTKQCNLTSINGSKITSLELWKQAVEAATIIGTLQAGYTSFKYLSSAAKELTEQEALLGVSLTGWFDNPEILLNPENQYMIAKLAVKVNKEWAQKLGIKQAARVTCVKPEGTSSLFLGSSSGIHPHHDHRYFRRVQMNKQDNVYQYFKMFNPHAVEESVWSATKTDDVITFPLEIPKSAKVKNDITAIQHLNYVKQVQENWVNPGTTEVNTNNVTHNVSCTIEVEEFEFKEVTEYLFNNRQYFAAVSLLPKTGDKLYKQPPLQRVYPELEKDWDDLIENWSTVNYMNLMEDEDNTSLAENLACAGGACDVTYLPTDKKAS